MEEKELKKQINKKYHEEGKSLQMVADEIGMTKTRLFRLMKKLGINTRDKSAAITTALAKGRKEHPNPKGSVRSEEVRKAISEGSHVYYSSLTEEEMEARLEMLSQAGRDRFASMSAEERMEMNRKATEARLEAAKFGSRLERFAVDGLVNAGFNVQPHVKGLIPNYNLEVDIVVRDAKTIVEIDGPTHFLPIWGEEELAKTRKSDIEKNGLFLGKGWNVIRVKCIKKNINNRAISIMVEDLVRELTTLRNRPPNSRGNLIEIEVQ